MSKRSLVLKTQSNDMKTSEEKPQPKKPKVNEKTSDSEGSSPKKIPKAKSYHGRSSRRKLELKPKDTKTLDSDSSSQALQIKTPNLKFSEISSTKPEVPYLEKTLNKQATLFFGKVVWHSRYFVLEDGKLHYWSNKSEKIKCNPAKKIPLEGCKITPWKSKQQSNAFRIFNPHLNKDWYLSCDNNTSAKEWVSALKIASGEKERDSMRISMSKPTKSVMASDRGKSGLKLSDSVSSYDLDYEDKIERKGSDSSASDSSSSKSLRKKNSKKFPGKPKPKDMNGSCRTSVRFEIHPDFKNNFNSDSSTSSISEDQIKDMKPVQSTKILNPNVVDATSTSDTS